MSSSKSPTKKQHSALKKLRASGLYSGKIPRGKLTKYQAGLVKKYDDVVKGKATVVRPKNPKDYGRIYRTSGDKVIVPKNKGEKIAVNKRGNIERTRKGPRGEKIKSTAHRSKPGELPPETTKRVQYAIPFARKLGKNKYRLEWVRFPTRESLAAFMAEYEKAGRYQDWTNFVFEEQISDASLKDRNEALNKAAVKYGRAKSENEFTEGSSDIMRLARRNRRERKRERFRQREARENGDE